LPIAAGSLEIEYSFIYVSSWMLFVLSGHQVDVLFFVCWSHNCHWMLIVYFVLVTEGFKLQVVVFICFSPGIVSCHIDWFPIPAVVVFS